MDEYKITEFLGIQQHKDGSLLPTGSAADCRNMVTFDGNLAVAKGYVKHIAVAVPGTDRILRHIIARGTTRTDYVVTASNVYYFNGAEWVSVHTFSPALTATQIDYLQTLIGTTDHIIIGTGAAQMVKINTSTKVAAAFGTGANSYSGTVSSYNAGTLTVTLSGTLTAEAQRHAPLDGITIDGVWLEVDSATSTTVTLVEAPDTEPSVGDTATIRGGGSDASCNFIDMYKGRLFSAGDPSNTSRLYWSAVPGDGRTIEDWLAVSGSVDASGGYVEVGDSSGDAITGIIALASEILIFKRYSFYRLYGDSPSNFTVERVESFAEYMSNASAVVKYNKPFFITKSGLKFYDGTGVIPIDSGIRYINTFIQSINSVTQSKGIHADNVLYFSCKVSSASTYDDALIVYDIARQAYTIRDGFQIADITQFDGTIYLINDARYVYEFNSGYTYDGAIINAYWETQHTDLQSKAFLKQINDILFRGGSGNIFVDVHFGANVTTQEQNMLESERYNVTRVRVETEQTSMFWVRLRNVRGSYFEVKGGMSIFFQANAGKLL
jgi:hypothetical protein